MCVLGGVLLDFLGLRGFLDFIIVYCFGCLMFDNCFGFLCVMCGGYKRLKFWIRFYLMIDEGCVRGIFKDVVVGEMRGLLWL